MPEAAAPAYRSGETDPREVMVMLMVEAVRFGGPRVLVRDPSGRITALS
jgi:hypothetical protein